MADPHDAVLAALDGPDREIGQALAVLAAAGVPAPEALTLAAGDRALLGLVRSLTGEDIEVTAGCPTCATVNSVLLSESSVDPVAPRSARCGRGGGLREPTYVDLLDLPSDPAEAADELARRCTVGTPSRSPTAADFDMVDESLAGPLLLNCVGCGGALEVPVDVERVALQRLARRAEDVDVEVHLLALAYHWELGTIEGLGSGRRHRLARLVSEGR